VAEELNVSRQAIKDTLDKTTVALINFEKDLQFVARDDKIKKILQDNKPEEAVRKILSFLED